MAFFHFGVLVILIIQSYGTANCVSTLADRSEHYCLVHICVRRKQTARKIKRLKTRGLCRKPRSTWIISGKTDKWWKCMRLRPYNA